MASERRSSGGRRARSRSPEPTHAPNNETDAASERAALARETGAAAFNTVRLALARTAAQLIRSDPADAATALEMGIVDRKWLDEPGEHPISTTTPAGIVERFLERVVERRPSRLSALGLSALQVLTAPNADTTAGTEQDVAVVFTDLEGFTSFTDTYGDDAALELLAEHYRQAGPLVRSFSGRIVKRLGDGLLCTFPDAELGLRCALEMLELPPPPLRLRAGVHVGSALVSRTDVVGQVVNIAARLAEIGKGGQVIVTEEAAAKAGDIPGARLSKPRPRRLKGISDPVRVRTVTKAG